MSPKNRKHVLDETPTVGPPTDEKRLREIGDEGVLALVCDSTNAMRDGKSPSETEVGKALAEIARAAKGRVAFTTFASNVGRIRSIALAAAAAEREVVVVGRAMRRVIDVATELGYLDGLPPFAVPLDEDHQRVAGVHAVGAVLELEVLERAQHVGAAVRGQVELAAPETPLEIDVRGRPLAARVVEVPFYRRPK